MEDRIFCDEYGIIATLKYNEELGQLYDNKCYWISFSPTFKPLCFKTLKGALKRLQKDGFIEQIK